MQAELKAKGWLWATAKRYMLESSIETKHTCITHDRNVNT